MAKAIRDRSRIRAAKLALELARIDLRAEARNYTEADAESVKAQIAAGDRLERSAIGFTEALAELRQADGPFCGARVRTEEPYASHPCLLRAGHRGRCE
jgi:hypothetical protein